MGDAPGEADGQLNDARLAAFAATAGPVQLLVFDEQLRIVWVNDRGRSVYGWDPDELLGISGFDLLHPDDLELAAFAIGLVPTADTSPRPGRYRIRNRDGDWVDSELTISPAVELDGRPHLVLSARPYQQRLSEIVDALATNAPASDTFRLLLSTLHDPAYGSASVIRFHEGPEAGAGEPVVRAACDPPDLPPMLAGLRPVQGQGPTPWGAAGATTGAVLIPDTSTLAGPVAVAARRAGFTSCAAQSVPDPSGRPPACIMRWTRSPGMAELSQAWFAREPVPLVELVLEMRHRRGQLDHAARHDPLTQLANRSQFFDEVDRLAQHREPLSVLYLDLDDFKGVNDTHGHAAGDEVLRVAAGRIGGAVRAEDLVARLGGDEFTVLCPGATPSQATTIAQRLIEALSEPIQLASGVLVRGAVSIGVASTDDGRRARAVVDAADRALYTAKRSGKGQWCTAIVAAD